MRYGQNLRVFGLACGLLLFVASAAYEEQKRIYIGPDDHTDYFWTAGEETYRQAFLEMIDYYLNLADATTTEAVEHQSRWNCDGSFWMWTYEKDKSQAAFERLIGRIRDGHISVPLNALCVCLGGTPAEAVLRGMYYPGQIERRYGLRFRLAYLIEDVPLPLGVSSLFVGSGARYGWKGICNCDTWIPEVPRVHEIYWAGGLDGSRLLLKWNSLLGDGGVGYPNQGIGGYAEARYPGQTVEFVDSDPTFTNRYPYPVIGAFGKGWDDLKTLTDEFVTVAKAKTNSQRLVRVSNETDFFEDFEATYGGTLPVYTASYGNEWALYCAALAEVSGRVKRAVEKLRVAEGLATLVSRKQSAFVSGRETSRDRTWMDLGLYWEHNLGMVWMYGSVVNDRIAWQRRLAGEIEGYVNTLYEDGVTSLGAMIQKSGSLPRCYAFNPLNWSRTDVVDWAYGSSTTCHVVEVATGLEVPSQIVTVEGQRRLRILAQDVLPVGYKVYEIRSGAGQAYDNAASATANVIESTGYRITMAERGAITSLIDKTRGNREFARTIGGRVINDLGASTGILAVENAGPVSVTIVTTGPAPLAHTTRLTLLRNLPRIEIQNEITQNFDQTYTWGFGFALDAPNVWHEEVGAILRARLLGGGGHYAHQNARYDWLTLNHFADMSSGSLGVTLSNADCYFMRLGDSTWSTLDTGTPQIAVLAGGRVVGTGYGLPNQGGDTHFLQRFALRTHDAYDPVAAMKFALEHQNPLVGGEVTGGAEYPSDSYSMLAISNPNVVAWAVKPSEEGMGRGIVVRLWNLASTTSSLTLSFSDASITSAGWVSHIETFEGAATVNAGRLTESLCGNQIKTFLVKAVQSTIAASPTSLSLECWSGGAISTTTLLVSNGTTQGSVLSYAVATTPTTWLSCAPTTGTSTGEVTTHTVIVNPSSLSAGDYAGTITITAPWASNSPVLVSVNVRVLDSTLSSVDPHASPQANLDLPDWNTTESAKMSVLKFRITDHGGDGLPTLIDRMQVKIGGTAGHADHDIAWAELRDGTSRVALASSITTSAIVFGVTPTSDSTAQLHSIVDNGFVEYTVFIYLDSSLLGAHDQTHEFRINESDVGVDGGSSSHMAPDGNRVTPVVGTLFITQLGISISPNTWTIGPCPLNAVLQSSSITMTNTGNVAEDFTVKGSDGAGGWLLSPATGQNAFRVDVDRENDSTYDFVLTTSELPLALNVPIGGGSRTMRLKYTAPSSDTYGAGVAQHFVVTVRASRHVP